MSRADAQVNQRMPHSLKDMLEGAAKSNKRSLTAEINARLENSFNAPGDDAKPAGGDSAVPALIGIDQKLRALCNHLGVNIEG